MSREFTEELKNLYENESPLWNVKSKEYHDRNKRDTAYEKLLSRQQEFESMAINDNILKKINDRKEKRKENEKIKQPIKSGASDETVDDSNMWYSSMLRFLSNKDMPSGSHSSLKNNFHNDNSVFGNDSDNENQTSQVLATSSAASGEKIYRAQRSICERTPINIRQKKHCVEEEKQESLANEVLLTAKDHFRKPVSKEDRFDMSGKTVAMKLRDLPKEQMLFADRIINDTLFLAEMGSLTLDHRVVNTAPKIAYYSPISSKTTSLRTPNSYNI